MEKHIIGENGISYTLKEDGLYYPDLQIPDGTHYEIGKYGRMRWEYLKNHRRREYIKLLMDGQLKEYLHEVDIQCYEREGTACGADESRSRYYRRIKSYRPDEVGRADE